MCVQETDHHLQEYVVHIQNSALALCLYQDPVQALTDAAEKATFSGTKLFVEKFIQTLKDNIQKSGQFFLFCVSKISDDPHQWAEFAEGARGICLEFSPNFAEEFSDIKEDDDGCCSNGNSPVFDVYYEEKRLCSCLQEIISECIKQVEAGLKATDPDKKEGLLFLQCMTVALAVWCVSYCTEYKPDKFSKENEIRFLRVVRADRTARNLRTRQAGNETRTYVDFPLCKNAIKTIWIGPLAPEGTKERIQKILDAKQWTHIDIKNSEIPFAKD